MSARGYRPKLALPLFAALIWPGFVSAQAPPQAGVPTREEIERIPVDPVDRTRGQALSVEGEVERAPCPLADPQFQNVTFQLASVEFAGLQALSPDLLRPAYADYVGQTLPIATVCEIRDRAATILRSAGYLAAVQVPPQRIENGVVRFDVLMAKLVGIQVRGDAGRSERLIAGYLERIQEQPVFNIRDAERYLLLARDLPGYDVRLTLRPAGTAPGEVIGEVAVIHTPVVLDVNVQNYGSRDTGRWGALARAQFNGLTGMGDATTVGFFSTADFEEQRVLQLGHAMRVGREGLTLSGDFTYAWTRPDLGGGLDLRSETLVASAIASYPFIRSQSLNLFGAFGLDYVDQDTRFSGVPLSEDSLRVLFARLDYNSLDAESIASTRGYSIVEPRWRVGASLELRHGLDVFDATTKCSDRADACAALPSPSRVDGDPTAFVARYSSFVEYRPSPTIAFSVSPRAQYAPDPLLSYEEFSLGTYTIGRGFDPGTLLGDSGLGFQSELRVGSLMPNARDAFAIQPFAFFDLGVVWNEDRAFDGIGHQDLYSAGGGVRAAYGDRGRLDLAVAVPLNRAGLQTERGDVRLLVSLTTKLLPWTR